VYVEEIYCLIVKKHLPGKNQRQERIDPCEGPDGDLTAEQTGVDIQIYILEFGTRGVEVRTVPLNCLDVPQIALINRYINALVMYGHEAMAPRPL